MTGSEGLLISATGSPVKVPSELGILFVAGEDNALSVLARLTGSLISEIVGHSPGVCAKSLTLTGSPSPDAGPSNARALGISGGVKK
jgi:hypothetical protein